MALSIQDIRANLNLGGARPTLFEVRLAMPAGVDLGNASRKFTFTCEASEIPPSTIGVIPVHYFGRVINLAGDRQFAPWQTRVLNDEDFVVRNAFETWHSLINTRVGNRRAFATDNPNLYKATGEIIQYDRQGKVIREYIVQGIWPTVVGGIGLDWAAQDQNEKFEVQFALDWWDVAGPTGNGGPSL